MAASVTLTGSGTIGTVRPGWSVTQECTPVAIGNSTGSVGSASVSAARHSDSDFIANNAFGLTHEHLGEFNGRVMSSNLQGLSVGMTVAGYPEFLNSTVTCPPAGYFTEFVTQFGEPGTGDGHFDQPSDVVFDHLGNLFVADYQNFRIQKFVPDGDGGYVYSARSPYSTGGSANGQFATFGSIYGLAVDSTNRVYAVDPGNARVQRFTNNLVYSAKFGTAGFGDGQFDVASGIAIDGSGNIFVSDRNLVRVQKFDSSFTFLTKWGSFGTGDGEFTEPYGLAVDAGGNVYVADPVGGRVQKFSNTGTYLAEGSSAEPYRIAVDGNGAIFTTSTSSIRVERWDATLNVVGGFGSFGTGLNQSQSATGVASSLTGLVAVPDSLQGRVLVYSAPSTNVMPLSAYFQRIVDLCAPGHTIVWSAADNPEVVYPAWRGNAWAMLKQLCATHHIQIATVSGQLTITDIGSTVLDITNKTVPSIQPEVAGGAQQINIVYQNTAAGDGMVMYEPDNIITFDATTLKTVLEQTTNFPTLLNNPVPVDSLPIGPGQYYVIDSTGTHVPAATWLYYGGGVFPNVGDVLGQIKLTLQGPGASITGYTAPYSLASGVGAARVPQLSITGSGVTTSPETLEHLTGADPATMTQQVGQTINIPFIGTLAEAYDRGAWAASKATGVDVTIQFEMNVADLAGFGLDQGSLVPYNDNIFRVSHVAYGNIAAPITAVRHCTIGDVLARFSGWTNADMKTLWAGFSNGDTKVKPFRSAQVAEWLYPATDMYPSTSLFPGPQS